MKEKNKLNQVYTLLLILGLMALSQNGLAQEVSGSITDAEVGGTLPGVNIVVKGTNIGTTTNTDGIYSINVPSLSDTLVFSFVGYETSEIPINGRTTIDVELEPSVILGEDVVVIGFGTQQKENLTGSIGTIQGDELSAQTSINASAALMGTTSGVQVVQNSGQPGNDGGTVRIRGIGTLGNSDPLVLIDGVEGNLDDVASSDIENISVLKDAASAAIYGSRAANGVILITTKRGGGKFEIDYTGRVGVQNAVNQPEFVDGGTYMRLHNLATTNLGKQPLFSEEEIQNWEENHPSDEYPNTDWVDAVFSEPAIQSQNQLTISGGSESVQYRGSLQYDQQNGEVNNFEFRRYNIRLNTDVTVSDKLSFIFDGSVIRKDQREPIGKILRQTYRLGAIHLDRFSDGSIAPGGLGGNNPVAAVCCGGLSTTENGIYTGRFQGQYQPFEGLEIKLMYSPEFNSTLMKNHDKQWISTDPETGEVLQTARNEPQISQMYERNFTNNLNTTIEYQTNVADNNFTVLGGYEFIDFRRDFFGASREGFALQDFGQLDAASRANQQNFGNATEFNLQSLFGRINYDFKEKYLLEANLRYDGSSRFSDGNRWGSFPSFSVGWRVTEETFMESLDFITNLKLRGSWGKLGNQQIGNYPFAASIDLGQVYLFGGNPVTGAAQVDLANSDITWETTTTTNIGADLSFLQDRLDLSFDWFNKTTDDILLNLPVPLIIGMNAPFQNAGSVENQGWEIEVGYNDVIGADFRYDISFNVSDVDNEVTDLAGAGPFIQGNSIIKVGEPINSIYGFESNGLFDSQEEIDNHAEQTGQIALGDIRYVDQNGDGVINDDDRTVIGDPFPHFNYGISIGANYKGFELSVFFQGIGSRDVLLRNDIGWPFFNNGNIQKWHAETFWTPENPNDDMPRLTQTTAHNNFRASDFWVYDGSYLRLRNLQIGYNIPTNWANKVSLKSLEVYFIGQNLWTGLDDMPPGIDPNVPNDVSGTIWPVQRVFTFGLDIKF